jgi:curved DNA-binding protein CbpA
MEMSENHRAVLGVGRDATAAEIRAAYRKAAKLAHPDLGGSSEAFRRVQAAVDALLAELTAAHATKRDRPRSHRDEDRASRGGHWMIVSAELRRAWGLTGEPVTVFPPQKIGLSPFVAGTNLNAPAYAWLTRIVGPQGEGWDFNITDSVARIFFRNSDHARMFKLRFF